MTVTDSIADMLTRIRNSLMAGHSMVSMPTSKMRASIAGILKEEGYVGEISVSDGYPSNMLRVELKYAGDRRTRQPVIAGIERVSKPGRRVYVGKSEIPWVKSGMGIVIMTTPQGVMTGHQARKLGVGGEILCKVW